LAIGGFAPQATFARDTLAAPSIAATLPVETL